ncbi:MAG: SAM-dependent methyltransferase [Chlamydiae bacterium CG10_big_fil_rev_8_21_14_0_10_42_34]|nr:MAG: SAM-dependent methyltransferase [Chlamydiae bacterium CG10_big_fil_rev_8_21_14_0_10_42_34]
MIELPQILDGEDKSSVLANRIRKNYRHVRKWAKRTDTNAFRIYDWEIGKYPLAIDFYDGRFCVQYFSRDRENPEPSVELEQEVEDIIGSIFGAKKKDIYWRSRIKRAKFQQYEKAGETKEFFTVLEYGVKFRINLTDYLDTGLFLDHRETRRYVASKSEGKRLLNLFAYTCSFSVHAAVKGALFTKSVDMSNTYTDWGRENFILNGIDKKNHPIIRADCLKFLSEEVRSGTKYDIIVIDPPTISRSKKMDQMFDVQIDYIFLIESALKLLAPKGVIYFSTNSRKFVFDVLHFANCDVLDVSDKTIPIDFHDPKIHRCWKITLSN